MDAATLKLAKAYANTQIVSKMDAINTNHFFADDTARDAYFTSNPTELVTGILVSSDEVYQMYDGTAWVTKTPVSGVAKADFDAHLAENVVVDVKAQLGSTDDEKIEVALTKLTNGDTLLFSEGNANGQYTPTTTINITQSNITVIISKNVTIKVNNFNEKLFNVTGSNVVFKGGGTIDCSKTGIPYQSAYSAIYFSNSSFSGVEDITIKNTDHTGIKFDTCDNCFACNNYLLGCYSGIQDYNSLSTRIINNTVDKLSNPNDANTNSDRGIRGNLAVNMLIEGNKVNGYSLCIELYYHCYRSIVKNNIVQNTGFGISLDQSDDSVVSSNILSGTTIALNITTMIELAQSKNCFVSSNRIQILDNTGEKGCGINAIGAATGDVNTGSDYSIINDNMITNTNIGINIGYSKYVEVKNNTIINTVTDGISFSNTLSSYCSIVNNSIITPGRYGILIPPERSYNNIEINSNSIFNSGGDSIEIQGSLNPSDTLLVNTNIRILNNIIVGSTGRGISATFSQGDIRGNLIRECQTSGIYLMSCNNVSGYITLHNNAVIDCVLNATSNEGGIYVNYIYSTVVLDAKGNYAPNEKNNGVGEFIYNVTGKATNSYVFVTSLPLAHKGWRGKTIVLEGGAGVADKVYTLMKNSADAYTWVQSVTG